MPVTKDERANFLAQHTHAYEQQETLIAAIRNIIKEYPNEAVFREFLQNADDAGAHKFHVIVDERSHETGSLLSEEMACWQGPAVWIFNDALFKDTEEENDFDSLLRIRESGKQFNNAKIGKFGVGFNSCFHFTDLPSFTSGSKLAFLDPHQTYLPSKTRGQWFHFQNDGFSELFEDQVTPYKGIEGFDFTKDYKGTLFRLPLRTKESGICQEIFSTVDILNLLNDLKKNVLSELIFLRNIESFEVSRIKKGETPAQIERLWIAAVVDLDDDTRDQRRSLMDDEAKEEVFCLSTKLESQSEETISRKWLVSTGCKTTVKDPSLEKWVKSNRLRPLGGVAASLDAKNVPTGGRMYSFLPLPQKTHLLVHLNGTWAQGSDRLSLILEDDDLPNLDKQKLKWNRHILLEFLPNLHVRLIQEALKLHKQGLVNLGDQPILKLWPFPMSDDKNAPKYMTEYGKKVLSIIPRKSPLFKVVASGTENFVSINAGCFGNDENIVKILCDLGQSAVHFPPLEDFKHAGIKHAIVDAKKVRDTIRNQDLQSKYSQDQLFALLNSILKDQEYGDLDGICLVPLMNKKFGTFESEKVRGRVTPYFIAKQEELKLFPDEILSRIVDETPFKDKLFSDKLFSPKFKNVINIKLFDATAIAIFLPSVLTPNRRVENWNPEASSIPNDDWLEKIWEYILRSDVAVEVFKGFPLLEVVTRERKPLQLTWMDERAPLLHLPFFLPYSSSDLLDALTKLGLKFTNRKPKTKTSKFIYSWSAANVLNIIEMLRHDKDISMEEFFARLSEEQVASFREFVKTEWKNFISNGIVIKEHKKLLQPLPIWLVHAKSTLCKAVSAPDCFLLPDKVQHTKIRSDKTFYNPEDHSQREYLILLGAQIRDPLTYIEHDVAFPNERTEEYISFLKQVLSLKITSIEEFLQSRPYFPSKFTPKLKRIDDLYDYENQVFQIVFGEDSDKFLHPDLVAESQEALEAAIRMGFKHEINAQTFIECAKKVEALSKFPRPPTNLRYRATVLIHYFYKNVDTLSISESEWALLKTIRFVPIEEKLDSPYNAHYDRKYKLECLNSICLPIYKNIAWSQMALCGQNVVPPETVLKKYPEIGKPDNAIVVEHLRFVRTEVFGSILWREQGRFLLPRILEDIYNALNKACQEEEFNLAEHLDLNESLFLNTNQNEDVFDDSNWVAADNLFLNVGNREIGYVKPVLKPYEEMLLSAGAKKLIRPWNSDDFDDVSQNDQASLLLKSLLTFLKDEAMPLHDVIFNVKGEKIKANRYLLAASSNHFKTQFTGSFSESDPSKPVEVVVTDIQPISFRVLLQYLYGGNLEAVINEALMTGGRKLSTDEPNEEDREAKQHVVHVSRLALYEDLLRASDYYNLDYLKKYMEVCISTLVDRPNVRRVCQLAETYSAEKLNKYCLDFIEINKKHL